MITSFYCIWNQCNKQFFNVLFQCDIFSLSLSTILISYFIKLWFWLHARVVHLIESNWMNAFSIYVSCRLIIALILLLLWLMTWNEEATRACNCCSTMRMMRTCQLNCLAHTHWQICIKKSTRIHIHMANDVILPFIHQCYIPCMYVFGKCCANVIFISFI